jgi:hypothetical protein
MATPIGTTQAITIKSICAPSRARIQPANGSIASAAGHHSPWLAPQTATSQTHW